MLLYLMKMLFVRKFQTRSPLFLTVPSNKVVIQNNFKSLCQQKEGNIRLESLCDHTFPTLAT